MLVNPTNPTTPAAKFGSMFFSAALEVSEPLLDEACEASDEPDADEVVVADAEAEAEPAAVEEGETAESCMEDTGSPDVLQAFVNSMFKNHLMYRLRRDKAKWSLRSTMFCVFVCCELASSPATPTKQFPQSAI
ncbi:hypothetical protein A7U60_g1634 [Sanghuangporus baumii]|uniref:Uncharacterized protein n=1 Tax=Sanghuangporus baumii TaxID=108892 RepID=A0A9Q5I4N9_SANBA|nr:hypothetical protein A7U60_g1634 [Sanghuangporus baumii]